MVKVVKYVSLILGAFYLEYFSSCLATPKEMEFSENLTGDGGVSGDIGGDIFIPIEQEDDVGTLDEPVTTTLVRRLRHLFQADRSLYIEISTLLLFDFNCTLVCFAVSIELKKWSS